jgi:CheY-like chemotaxis protein
MMKLVLVIDDEFSIVETLGEVLEWEGYRLASAANGKAGLQAARAERPDLILLDYMMPVMDGLQMLRALRADPALASVPVIMMTAAPLGIPDADHLWDALLLKPFEASQLAREVGRLIGPPR